MKAIIEHALKRRSFLMRGATAALTTLPSVTIWAKDYPEHSVEVIIGSAPGGITDIVVRIATDYLSRELKQAFVVSNRVGAGGNLAAAAAARAPKNGYVLTGVASSQIFINPLVYKDMRVDMIKDFAPVFNIAAAPMVIAVNGASPAKSLKEFIARAKSASPALTYGSAGVGTTPHLAGEIFAQKAGVKLLHVPFNGTGPALNELIAGRIDLILAGLAVFRSAVDSGRVHLLAAAAPQRLQALPELETTAEAGLPGFEVSTWFGILAPAGTSADIIDRINGALQKMLGDAESKQRFMNLGLEPNGGSSQSITEAIRREKPMWDAAVQVAGLTPQ